MIGIALAGGGARGAAHLGILQAFEEHGIQADCYTGASSGSIVATAKAFGYRNRDIQTFLEEVNMSMMDYDYWGVLWALPRGLSTIEAITKGKKLKEFLKRHFGNQNIGNARYPLGIVSTDINTGAQIIYSNKELIFPEPIDNLVQTYIGFVNLELDQMLYSSSALPGIFPPLQFDGHKLVDGGIVNNLPADIAKGLGADKIIAIDLQGKHRMPVGIPSMVAATISTLISQNDYLSLDFSGDCLYLNIDLGDITILQFDRAKEAHTIGYQYGLSVLDTVKAYLQGT